MKERHYSFGTIPKNENVGGVMKSLLMGVLLTITSFSFAGNISGSFNHQHEEIAVDQVDIVKSSEYYSIEVMTMSYTPRGLTFFIDGEFSYADASALASDLLKPNSSIQCGHYDTDLLSTSGSLNCNYSMLTLKP